jgi:hypothetical protein
MDLLRDWRTWEVAPALTLFFLSFPMGLFVYWAGPVLEKAWKNRSKWARRAQYAKLSAREQLLTHVPTVSDTEALMLDGHLQSMSVTTFLVANPFLGQGALVIALGLIFGRFSRVLLTCAVAFAATGACTSLFFGLRLMRPLYHRMADVLPSERRRLKQEIEFLERGLNDSD